MPAHEHQKSANPEALSSRGIFWYDLRLKDRARELRNNPTPWEVNVWKEFLSNNPLNFQFLRQKPIGYYILDFYCSELLLAIEIDGPIHDKDYDRERDAYLSACGIKVLRIKNDDIMQSLDSVKDNILREITFLKDRHLVPA